MVHVKDLLTLQSLSGSRIVAGEKALLRVVKSANVMEVPDIGQWAQEGDFLITTGLPIRHLPEVQRSLAADLHRIGVAALAFKPKRFVDEIPGEILSGANECGLPVLLLPESAVFSTIVYEVVKQVVAESMLDDSHNDPREAFAKAWLHEDTLAEADIAAQLRRFGYPTAKPFAVLAIGRGNLTPDHPEVLWWRGTVCPHAPCLEMDGDLFTVFSGSPENLLPPPSTADPASRYVVSGWHGNWREARGAVAEARTALQIARLTDQTELLHYSGLGLDLLLLSISKEPEAMALLRSLLNPLLDYDAKTRGELVHTLETYLDSNHNAKRAAALLHAHYNTIIYRIQKIESLLDRSLDDSRTALQLAVALKLRPYLDS